MHSKGIKITILLVIILIVFSGLFIHLKRDFEILPSEGWSKELELFEIDSSSEFSDFFNKRIGYAMLDDRLNILYVEDNSVKFKSYNKDMSIVDEGTLIINDYPIEKMFVDAKDDEIKVILMQEKTFNFYSFSKTLEKSSVEYEIVLGNNSYHVSNGYLVIRNGDNYDIVSNEGAIMLELENRPYSVESFINDTDNGLEVFYSEFKESVLGVKYASFNNENELVSTLDIAPFLTGRLKLKLLDFQVKKDERYATLILNIKDTKDGVTFLNYYKYDLKEKKLVEANVFEQFHDKTELFTSSKMLVSSKGNSVAKFVGRDYAKFYNVLIYNFDTEDLRLLTKTRLDPRNYIYIEGDEHDYLVWGELHKGTLTLNFSSDNPEDITSSIEMTPKRFGIIFFDTIGAYMAIPVYALMMATATIVIVMLVAAPGYMIFVSLFERRAKVIFLFMIILHNIGKLAIHFSFISNVDLPVMLKTLTVPIIILTNIVAIYNSRLLKPNYKFDNVIFEYIPFFITDILLHTMIFGPYIMMQL